jgi:hypothetical protein
MHFISSLYWYDFYSDSPYLNSNFELENPNSIYLMFSQNCPMNIKICLYVLDQHIGRLWLDPSDRSRFSQHESTWGVVWFLGLCFDFGLLQFHFSRATWNQWGRGINLFFFCSTPWFQMKLSWFVFYPAFFLYFSFVFF